MKAAAPLLSLSLALMLAGCGDSPQARFERARKAFGAHDYRAAQVDLAAALREQPNSLAMLALQARTQLALGDGVAAQASLEKLAAAGGRDEGWALLAGEAALLRDQPKAALEAVADQRSAEAHRIRALAQIGLEKPDEAASEFAAGAAAAGPKARLHADHARFVLGRGEVGQARELVGKARAESRDTLEVLLADGEVAVAEGDLGHALKSYDAALRRYPGNLAAVTGKAGVLGDLGRVKDMVGLVAQAAAAAPDSPAVAYLQARVAAERKDWAKVRTILQPLEAQLTGRDAAQLLYAQAELELGQAEQARSRLAQVVRRAPANRLALRLLARAQLDGGDPQAAMATLRALVARPEAGREELALMARAAKAAGDPQAASLAARARFPAPQELASELARADAAIKAGNWAAAIAAYDRLLAVTDGTNAIVLNNMAFAQSQVGNKDKALAFAMRALRHAPDNPSVMDTAAWLLVETGGDKARALDLLREAARKAPANATIQRHLKAAEAFG